MQQVILITAYKDFEQLFEISNYFGDSFHLYIHIDKKSKIDTLMLNQLMALNNVKWVTNKYKVNWGSYNHLKSIILLAEEALKNSDNQYFHLITGQDFPIKSKSEFQEHFKKNNKSIYLENFTLPSPCFNNGGMHRIEYFNLYDVFDAKRQLRWIQLFIRLQKKIGFKRKLSGKLPQLYAGSTYWSMPRRALEFSIEKSSHNLMLLNRLKHTFCAEEIYFQTILMNSDFNIHVNSDNLRHIDWEKRNGSIPAILDKSDLSKLLSTNAFFARKFDKRISNELKKKLLDILNG